MMGTENSKYKNASRQTVKLIPEDSDTYPKAKVGIKQCHEHQSTN